MLVGTGLSPDTDVTRLSRRIILYLGVTGFSITSFIEIFDLRLDVISALVERWCPESHTFYLPCQEYTVMLEDVSVQLGLSTDGLELALNSFSDVVLRAMSRDKSQDKEHKQLTSSATVSGFTPNAISSIRESPTTRVATY
ncbi:hypothetical protein PVK06_007639 [Gossypium arboreum]|uniref:Aminotransferase-like plant mobile domain-containing protein n=1 Tax=Gossypium arboreum TaxID=29729 RepID=A0ABR0QIV3_GOSAR|nr:hypothetical protein PVK06_007639 [Gossypium arboreum]